MSKHLEKLSPERRRLFELLLEEKRQKNSSIQAIPRRTVEHDVYPLSFGQQRLWFLDQWEPGNPAYNLLQALQLRGQLRIDALQQCLDIIAQRHEILRTTITTHQEDPVQVIAAAQSVALTVINLDHLPQEEQQDAIQHHAVTIVQSPFDLAQGPLWRATLIRLKATEHILLLTMHHIISDGWSHGVMFREMGALYAAILNGQPPVLSELPIQFVDFALWQREWLQGHILEQQLGYWKEQLADVSSILDLPTDYPRPTTITHQGAHHYIAFPAPVVEGIKSLSQETGCSLFMTLLAAFKTLLYRYTRQADMLVGSPISNRNRSEIEGLIGFFVNTLVIRTSVHSHLSFRDVLHQVRETTLAAYNHQDVPFEKLIEELNLARDLSHTPLFQVMFALQNTPAPDVQLPGLTLSLLEIDSKTTQFDILLELYEGPQGLQGSFQYNTALFEPSTIARMHGHFHNLLESITTSPDQRIVDVPLLTLAERTHILDVWNPSVQTSLDGPWLPQCIADQVARTPDAIAINAGTNQLTYTALDWETTQLASHIYRLAPTIEAPVGVCLERSLDLIISLLAILKAGRAYVPLDPSYPEDRLSFMIEDTNLQCIITNRSFTDRFSQHSAHLIDLDEAIPPSPEVPVLPNNVDPDQLAYIIYTSGSTGQPKGAMNTHRAIYNRLWWMQDTYQLTPHDRVLQKTPFSFDVSVWEFFWPLMVGARLIVAEPDGHRDNAYLVDVITTQSVTTIHFVPSMLHIFLDHPQVSQCQSLQRVFCSGEALPVALTDRFFDRLNTSLHNLYGPTEAAVDVSFWECLPDITAHTIPIGHPIQNIQLYVLDPAMQLVPVGISGELHIGGIGLARGYCHRPALTAERFVPHPYSTAPGERLYQTGDITKLRTDGAIEYLGRLDHQVKIRGFRVELGEIEATLRQHPTIREALVVAHHRDLGDSRLISYIIPDTTMTPSLRDVRMFLQDQLPDYMLPSAVVELDAFPLLPNGKLDRRSLPVPDQSTAISHTFVAPRNATEDVVANIWAAVLERQRISVHDNFFELGGHSLVATHVVSRINHTFAVDMPVRALFEAPTVVEFVAKLEETRARTQQAVVPPIAPISRDTPLPLSFAQRRLWFLDQLIPGNPAYNVPPAARITGPLDLAVFIRSIDFMMHRHEAFRTYFTVVEGQAVQRIDEPKPFVMPVIDLRAIPDTARESYALALATQEAQRSFDLTKSPLLRITLFQLEDETHIILLLTHHIIYDAMSGLAFVKEMRTVYEAFLANTDPNLPPLTIQYADFAYWQQHWFRGEVLEQHLAYWKSHLSDATTTLELPTDRTRPAMQTFNGAGYALRVNDTDTQALKSLCHHEGATLYMVLLSIFNVLLYRYTGQTDLVVGSPVANRNRHEIEQLIGFFVNSLVLRTQLHGKLTGRELIGRVRETALEAYAHQDLPLDILIEHLQPERDISRNPLFQVMFGFLHNYMVPVEGLANLQLNLIRIHREAAQFDLSLDFWEMRDGLHGAFEYNTDLFDASTIERMAGHVYTLLANMLANPDQPISAIPMLTDAEQDHIVHHWSHTQDTAIDAACVHTQFERQVAQTPDVIAVVDENTHITYAVLNQRANQVAQYLHTYGVQPDSLVGIALPRSLDLIISMLGVLKSGGAYVPLDPTYPPERLAMMVEDATTCALITEDATQILQASPEFPIIALDRDWSTIVQQDPKVLAFNMMPAHTAYVMYTSGTTGKPKGVVIPHGALGHYAKVAHQKYGLHVGDRMLQFASISFDASVEEIYATLISGATLVLRTDTMLSSVDTFLSTCQKRAITVLDLPTAYWHELVIKLPELEMPFPEDIRLVIIGGERALVERLEIWRTHISSQVQLVNTYGPTETTVVVTMANITTPQNGTPRSSRIPIGQPIPTTYAYILGRDGQLVPAGVPGILYIGGAGLGRGYLRQSGMTAERFMPDQYSGIPGMRFYNTGDLARYWADGTIEFVGRADHQVKIRGFRIEPQEIEKALGYHPAVDTALVLTQEEVPGDKRLVAYVVSRQADLTTTELYHFLKESMPQYMIPSFFVLLESLPLLPNGKVDLRSLPQPDQTRPIQATSYVAPRTPVEEVLAGIGAEILQREQIGIHDNFFELGGHSLLATQFMSWIRETFQVELPLQQFFQEPTVATISEYLLQDQNEQLRITRTAELMLELAEISDEDTELLEDQ